jgi:integrase
VVIPVGEPLRRVLEASKRVGPTILTNSFGQPWNEWAFQKAFGTARDKAGVKGVTFNDLRGTAVTRLALAGSTEPEIATITGHSMKQVSSILERHYLHKDPVLAQNAIRKLELAFLSLQNAAK